MPAGDEHQLPSGIAQAPQGVDRGIVDSPVVRQRAVVIGGKAEVDHARHPMPLPIAANVLLRVLACTNP